MFVYFHSDETGIVQICYSYDNICIIFGVQTISFLWEPTVLLFLSTFSLIFLRQTLYRSFFHIPIFRWISYILLFIFVLYFIFH